MIFSLHIAIEPEKIFEIFGFDITNTFFLSILIGFFLVIFFAISFKNKKMIPNSLQNFVELILESLFNFIDSITRDRKKTLEIFPLASTLFVLILSCNFIELAPGLGVFSFLRSPSSDLNFTLALAIISILFINISAVRKLGFFSYLKKFLNFKNPILFFVSVLEGISEFIRIISLSVRLFGNLFAGEVLLIVISSLSVYLFPLPFLGLEILVGFIQALIFSSLVVIFYTTSTELSHG